jgi:predicted transcriptional regulator
MGFLWFGKKKDESFKDEIKDSFAEVKADVDKISAWINHLHTQDKKHNTRVEELYDEILKIKEDIDGIKSFISYFDSSLSRGVFKHPRTAVYKQTAVLGVQTPIFNANFKNLQSMQNGEYGSESDFASNYGSFLRGMSQTERTIVWIVLNSELKLSCDDIAALLGKERATVRGQLNSIKRKNENLILEHVEKNGKKRYYIDPRVKEGLLKQLKAKVKKRKSESLYV